LSPFSFLFLLLFEDSERLAIRQTLEAPFWANTRSRTVAVS
jgi:hypothetical protein